MNEKTFTFKPVNSCNWKELENFFESKGGPQYCWCMAWRNMNEGTSRSSKSDKKKSLKSYVERKIPIGLLCYSNSGPIAWCSIAPRNNYRDLAGDNTLKNVWSLVCFFIKREYRKQRMTEKLISEALKYAKDNGAKYVEAYPVNPDSPSFRFMGFKSTFDKMGFKFKKKAGKRRNVMLVKL
jgi:GNAT superfamily N-acetyltransferase